MGVICILYCSQVLEHFSTSHMRGNMETMSEASAQHSRVNVPDKYSQISTSAECITLTFQLCDLILLLFMNEREQYSLYNSENDKALNKMYLPFMKKKSKYLLK